MTYEAVGTVQMNFLRILSEEARQNFTYTCINSVAWYSAKQDGYDLSLKLMTANEMEIGYDTTSPSISVIADGCRSGKSKGESVLELRTRKLDFMPIIDFYPVDYGQPNQAFGFQMGPVCFK